MNLSDLDYPLPRELIAQHPTPNREKSRLLVVDRDSGELQHQHFFDLPDLLPPGSCLFRNNASVFKARLKASRPTGGQLECLLLRQLDSTPEKGETWECLLKPGKKSPVGSTFALKPAFTAEVLAKTADGRVQVHFKELASYHSVVEMANAVGEVPLPPYIHRDETHPGPEDEGRYQTVYADPAKMVAAAAPTAGLHFTPDIIQRGLCRGFQYFDLTLHVGLGTFLPVQTEKLEDHPIHAELYELPVETRQALHDPHSNKVAIGTTTVRATQDYFNQPESQAAAKDRPFVREADLFIIPPFEFLQLDALVTNFHLPKSTLLSLVGAYLTPGSTDGIEWIKEIYAVAVEKKYRFFSYGDAMLIL